MTLVRRVVVPLRAALVLLFALLVVLQTLSFPGQFAHMAREHPDQADLRWPLTAFVVGPLTQFVTIPLMTTGAGAEAIGSWYGTGPERGMALVFTVAGVLGVIMTTIAFNSRQYRQLSATYANAPEPSPAG